MTTDNIQRLLTPRLSGLDIDYKNWYKIEFQYNNEKSYSWLKNKVPQKIDFRAVGAHESHPSAWELSPYLG